MPTELTPAPFRFTQQFPNAFEHPGGYAKMFGNNSGSVVESFSLILRTTIDLFGSLAGTCRKANHIYQGIFFISAYMDFIDPNITYLPPQATELLDYDDYRVKDGMGLVVSNLSFRYPGQAEDVLHNIDLTIEPGSTLAVVGVNGGGKTTLIKVLMGLYDHQGTLRLNGHPIHSYDTASIHKRTACAFQDFGKYSFTLRNAEWRTVEVLEKVGMDGMLNRSGKPKAPEEQVTIVSGDTSEEKVVVAASTGLSGGQWQRVALSRIFMREDADLVVFDEPSASLDPKAEAELFERIHSLSHQSGRRCTTIYISHRFSTVRRADKIAVVENGTIIECGNHSELMAKVGRYAEMFNLQKAGFED